MKSFEDIDMIYLLTAIELPPGGSSTVHIYTKQYTERHKTNNIEQHKKFGRVRAVPRLCELHPGICLTTEEKSWKNLSQVSPRVPAGTMKILMVQSSLKSCHMTTLNSESS
jgi:hypothetical protein